MSFIASVYIFKKLEPNIKISFRKFDIIKFKEIFSSSIWNSFGWIGTILFLQIDLMVANWNLGPRLAGEYSAVLQLSTILRTFAGVITSIFTPTIVALYATKKIKELVRYSNDAVNLTGLLISLPIGLICGLGGVFLSIWIDPSFIKYQGLLSLLTIHLSVNLSVQSLFAVQTAVNKVKIPAIVTVIMGVMNLGLALLFSGPIGMGAWGIALAGAIVLTTKNLVFTPIYVALITNQPYYTYFKGVIRPIVATCGIAGVGYLVQNTVDINNWYSFFIVCIVLSALYVIVVYLFLLNKEERAMCVKIAKSFVKNK
jgi:membrane protein EpsK